MLYTVMVWILDTLIAPWFSYWDEAGISSWVIGGFILTTIFSLLGALSSKAHERMTDKDGRAAAHQRMRDFNNSQGW